LSLLGQGMGLAGLLRGPLLRGIEAALAAVGLVAAWRARPPRLLVPRVAPSARVPAILIAISLGLSFAVMRLPDTGEDAMVYHLAAPEHDLALGRMNAEPWHFVWQMPRGAETLLLLPLHAGGIAAAKLVNGVALLAGAALVATLG